MADLLGKETVGALLLGLAIGGGGAVALDPIKGEQIADISVAEYVTGKSDTETKTLVAGDEVTEAQTIQIQRVTPFSYVDSIGQTVSGIDTTYISRDIPRTVSRPSQNLRVDIPPDQIGNAVLVTVAVGDKILGVTQLDAAEAPEAGKVLRVTVESMVQEVRE